jgi:hypothetical protein
MKVGGKQSNRLVSNFRLYRKHWHAVGQNETAEPQSTTERTNRSFHDPGKSGSAGLGKIQGNRVRVCWAGNRHVRERRQVSAVGDDGADITEGTRDIRVEADECPERVYCLPVDYLACHILSH